MTKCYRVWYDDDVAVLVDATSEIDAKGRAILIKNDARIIRIECLK